MVATQQGISPHTTHYLCINVSAQEIRLKTVTHHLVMAIVSILQVYRLRNPQLFLSKPFLPTQQFHIKHPKTKLQFQMKYPEP